MTRAPVSVLNNLVIEALKELSDPIYQQEVWIEASRPSEMSSLGEATEALFSDSCLGEALEKNPVTYSPEIDAELRGLQKVLVSFLKNEPVMDIRDMVRTTQWAAVREKAGKLHSAIVVRIV